MRSKIRRILVAVADANAARVIRRASDLALKSGATLELFSVVRPDSRILGLPNPTLLEINKLTAEQRRAALERRARPLRRRGLEVSCTVVTHDSLSDSVAARLKQAPADLVAIEAHRHGTLARLFLLQSDYELIRYCPVPLLIVKKPASADKPVLAAIDPWHKNRKPRNLDARIIAAAHWVSRTAGAPLHSVHVYSPLLGLVDSSPFAPVVLPVSLPEEKAHAARIRGRFRTLNERYGISAKRSHLEVGDPAFLLPQVARSLKAQLVVMGAVSRSALRRFVVGSTAERVLDELGCDVLIVKPAGR